MSLDDKVREVFDSALIVPKELARRDYFRRIPRYVSEFLIAKYVDPQDPSPGLEQIESLLEEHHPGPGRAELVRDRLFRTGQYLILDEIEVRVDLVNKIYWARIPSLNERHARIRPNLTERFPALLAGGLWGTALLKYAPLELKGKVYPIEIVDFEPYQARATSLDRYLEGRKKFTSDEWMDLLLRSVGYEPTFLSRRVKLLYLARLLPLVEPNLNLIELGPRETGKTFLLRNTSPHAFVISGGRITPANLFANLSTGRPGVLVTRKVVFFDEIAHTRFEEADTTLSMLKDYMETGQFSRGHRTYSSDASIVFAGNIDIDENGSPSSRYVCLFSVLPEAMQDVALLDRLHGFIPGWELPKVSERLLAKGYGLVSDYLADVFNHLRGLDFQKVSRHCRLRSKGLAEPTVRDERAVTRLITGFVKLLYPHGVMTDQEWDEIADLAVELRQRVYDQLSCMAPGEYVKKRLFFGEGCGAPEVGGTDDGKKIDHA